MDYHAYFSIDCELEEIQKPVDFMTAANSGRNIKPLHPHENGVNEYRSIAQWFYWFYWFARNWDSGTYNSKNCLEYMNGQWFIEPEGEEEGNESSIE
jgi:hypothetical protein